MCGEGSYKAPIVGCAPCPKPSCTSTKELVGTCSSQGYRCVTKCKDDEYRQFNQLGNGACTTTPVCKSNEELVSMMGWKCLTKCAEDEYHPFIGGDCQTCGNLKCPQGTNRAPGTCGTIKSSFTCINADYDFCAATASPWTVAKKESDWHTGDLVTQYASKVSIVGAVIAGTRVLSGVLVVPQVTSIMKITFIDLKIWQQYSYTTLLLKGEFTINANNNH